jgi:hypothetical protein
MKTRKAVAFRAVCIAAALTLVAGASLAQDPREERARVELDKAAMHQAAGDLDKALVAYQRAYDILPSYNVLWNLAQLQAELGMYAAARATYQLYLEQGTDKVPVSRAARARQEIARFDAMLGEIRVVSEVDGALVFVDGRQVGVTPLPEALSAAVGPRKVVVKRGKKIIFSEVVTVARGTASLVQVRSGVVVEDAKTGDDGDDGPERGKRVWTWVALGVGGAALVAGGITGGVVLSKAGELEDGCPDKQCPESQWSTLDSAGNLATVTNVLLGVGAAAVVAGVILFFVEPGPGDESEIAVAPTATDSGAGVALSGRF